eukprot:PhF_6_TR41082/c0_g1_i1/m.62238
MKLFFLVLVFCVSFSFAQDEEDYFEDESKEFIPIDAMEDSPRPTTQPSDAVRKHDVTKEKRPAEEVDEPSDFDEDEFEGFGSSSNDVLKEDQTKSKSETPPTSPPAKAFRMRRSPETMEYVGFGLIALFLTNFVIGFLQNRWLAQSVYRSVVALLKVQFHSVEPLGMDGCHVYTIYATGRNKCQFLLVTIILIPRQNIFYRILGLLGVYRDTVTVEVSPSECESVVFGVVRVSCVKQFWAEQPILEQASCVDITGSVGKAMSVPPSFRLLCEAKEFVALFFPEFLKDFVKHHEVNVEHCFLCDIGLSLDDMIYRSTIAYLNECDNVKKHMVTPPPCILVGDAIVCVKFNGLDCVRRLNEAVGVVLQWNDHVTGVKLSDVMRKKQEKKRKDMQENEFRRLKGDTKKK